MMIGLVAVLTIKPGMEEKAYEICRQMAEEVNKKEQGCLLYEPYRSRENPSEIFFIEKYSDIEDLEKHRNTEHYLAFREKIKDLLEKPPVVTELDPLI